MRILNYGSLNLDHVYQVARFVAPGGRLIMGDYGSRSRRRSPRDVAAVLRRHRPVAGEAWGGEPPIARFAWVDA